MRYRKDIDGLRAVAVGGVVIYHAFPAVLPGGFVGVDVFFVISGFLITSIIASDAEASRFSIGGFYERRFRRILPALAFMLAITTCAAVVILPPGELKQYGQSLLAVAAFGSNVLFWHEGGYFDGPAGDKPLLHTWSLAVEEQFYIVWPLIAAALIALGHRRLLKQFVWAAVLVSLAASEIVVRLWPSQAFYLIPYRAWELGFGALLAVGALPSLRGRLQREGAAWAGLALIAFPMLIYTEDLPFPGLSAVPPCLGTLLLIHAGQGAPTRAGQMLSWRPVLFVGLTSYSFYLWHWPVLVLLHIALNRPLHAPEAAMAVLAAFALAAFSLRFVEQPFRERGAIRLSRRAALGASGSMLTMFAAAGAGGWVANGFEAFVSPQVAAAEHATKSVNIYRARCHNDGHTAALSAPADCMAGTGQMGGGYQVLLWGDSHADHLMPGLAGLARSEGFAIRQSTASGCSPLAILSSSSDPRHPSCAKVHRATLDEAAAQPALGAIIVSARWSAILQGIANAAPAQVEGPRRDHAAMSALRGRLESLVRRIRATTGTDTRILIIGSTPEFNFWPANCFARAAKLGSDPEYCRKAPPKDSHWGPLADRVLADFETPGVSVILPRAYFCAEESFCSTVAGGAILYRDDDHLSNEGARFVASRLRPALEDLWGRPASGGPAPQARSPVEAALPSPAIASAIDGPAASSTGAAGKVRRRTSASGISRRIQSSMDSRISQRRSNRLPASCALISRRTSTDSSRQSVT
ncbi:acyltransferase [Novosphingobium endophyticum]|uniref:Acyltransferase n=1 Tax=Novosphingobium endophyticum TaxID=1955250 RepID=A0A916X6S5_9SPHN|nr:acyltransferase [Novosphingobium endophyticum]